VPGDKVTLAMAAAAFGSLTTEAFGRSSSSGAKSGSSALRRRWTARACSCDTRDSLTPISAPICFIVTSPK
jgi:hypothetical protein